MTREWTCFPAIELPTPVLAALCAPDGVWAGGWGGVARYSVEGGWTPLFTDLPLRSVTALAFGVGCLIAGHGRGIARSTDLGQSWQQCAVPSGTNTITALALSPYFPQDGTALAATLDNGILWSTDSGQSWKSANFGLQSLQVSALVWRDGEKVVAATSSGLHQSPNAGRAWQVCSQMPEVAFAAVTILSDGILLAAPEIGRPLCSNLDQTNWTPLSNLPEEIHVLALVALDDGSVVLSSADHGILRSADGGASWSEVLQKQAFSLAAEEKRVFAGTGSGVSASVDGGDTWTALPAVPLHDYQRLLTIEGEVVVAGIHSPPVKSGPERKWTELVSMPLPLIGLFKAPNGAIFASSPDGLFRSTDIGASWELEVAGGAGAVSQMTFLGNDGWAGVTKDDSLLRTRDGGRTWTPLPSPFGTLPLVALQAIPGTAIRRSSYLIAATYDERQRAVGIWRSDDGEHWVRGADSYTLWPIVGTLGAPTVVTVGSVISTEQPDGTWQQAAAGETAVYKVVSDGTTIFALALDGVWRSEDMGATWRRDDEGLAADAVLDIALDSGVLYVLLAGGRLRARSVNAA